ncbi:hypothetical protein IFR04_004673 [Cadophora malorum]|uniref:2EXR domain-containing protein n=1 Tax=Cadophora malorum TaxID=108018 RepID=A0A8H8BRS1_9HELO|nr:hypothetical protein IFR04_004673 [Cadophora malorum]
MAGLALRKRFTCFTKLPLEVRLLIWEASLPGPRIVSIRQRPLRKTYLDFREEKGYDWPLIEDFGDEEDGKLDEAQEEERRDARRSICFWRGELLDEQNMSVFWDMHMLGIDSDCPPPNIMFACREAYQVATRSYTKAFAYPESVPGTYINFVTDILYLKEDYFSHYSGYQGSLSIVEGLIGYFAITDTESLRRVRTLAVLLGPQDYLQPLEDFLCHLLRIFEGVEELLLVARDYNTTPVQDYQPDSTGQGCFIDAIHPPAAIRAYSVYRRDLLAGSLPNVQLPEHHNAGWVKLSAKLAKVLWKASRQPTSTREFPDTRIVNIVPQRLKRDFDQAKALYEQALEVYQINEDIRKREELHAAGFCTDDALSDDDF